MAVRSETELYAPVKAYFEAQGYEIRGEVRHCDLVAIRGEEPPVVVELKRSFSIPLLLQGIDRQKITRSVYVAFELPAKGRAPHGAAWPELRRLCQRLGLGMLTVRFYKTRPPRVEAECHPPGHGYEDGAAGGSGLPRHSRKAEARVVREFRERGADYNVGGSSKRKLVTAYREKSLQLAWLLKRRGPSSPRALRDWTGNGRAAGMLQSNVYGWFRRVQRGVYELTPAGEEALEIFSYVLISFETMPGAKE